MKNIMNFEEFINEGNKGQGHKRAPGDPKEDGLYTGGGKYALKGTGYANAAKAESTCKQLDGLEKKGEHMWAMSVATTMLNRAEKHQHQTPEMRDAIKVFKAWIEKNRTTGKK